MGTPGSPGFAEVVFDEPVALQPVLQMFARDLPEGAAVLQVLWCPNEPEETPESFGGLFGPSVAVRRWRDADLTDPRDDRPTAHPRNPDHDLSGRPGGAPAPESTVDHPSVFALPDSPAERIRAWQEETGTTASTDGLSSLQGLNPGGHPAWG
ncbi:hypothetical protein FOF52_04385 [Thermobifida alba]|uniref:Uncharacterized protein n=1 Tax=Thermobifida alba TaxID=53522 RepID=A0ABY4KY02_THEAE|nr:hypothetical protein [Thermobifida alba]UPT20295.1 hypothetical protein FOF52_04385 [Thermobifida alba]